MISWLLRGIEPNRPTHGCPLPTEISEDAHTLSCGTLSAKSYMVFDMTAVELVDSAGLGMLIHAYGSLRSRTGTLRLCGVAPRVLSLLELTNINTLLPIDPTLAESLAALDA